MATAAASNDAGVRGGSFGLRLVPQATVPGGLVMTRRMLQGAGVDARARVLALAPGFSPTTAGVIRSWPRSWTGVEPLEPALSDARKAAAPSRPGPLGLLERIVHGVDPAPSDLAEVVRAPLDRTGLPDESISSAYGEGVLSGCEEGGIEAILSELARVLEPGGRCAFHELTLSYTATPSVVSRLAEVGLRALTPDAWRAACEAAGLVPCGETSGPIAHPGGAELIADGGLGGALGRMKALARNRDAAGLARTAYRTLRDAGDQLEAIVVLAERPLIAGLRAPASA